MIGTIESTILLKSATKYLNQAEKELGFVVDLDKAFEQKLQELDEHRREMLYLDKGHQDIINIASLTLDIEISRKRLDASKYKLSSYLSASLSYLIELYAASIGNTGSFFLPQVASKLRQIVLIVRYTKNTDVDYSCLMSLAIRCDSLYYCSSKENRNSVSGVINQQIKMLINAIG